MDSMRSLNRSLPVEPSEDLSSIFKAAATAVTNLYKQAIARETHAQAQARLSGYQDALDDLLLFLDQKNLGLQDGEGWLVRQWATKLLDDRPSTQAQSNDEEQANESEEEPENKKEKSPSPAQGDSSPIHQPQHQQVERGKSILTVPTAETFTFQSAHPYPKDIEMQMVETASKRELSPKAIRHRKSGKQRIPSSKNLGSTGSKRKMPFGEFFDISELTTDNKDEGRKPSTRRKLA